MAQYGWTQRIGPDYLPTGTLLSYSDQAGWGGMGVGWHFNAAPERQTFVPPGYDGSTVIRQPYGYYPGCSLGDQSGQWGWGGPNSFYPFLAVPADAYAEQRQRNVQIGRELVGPQGRRVWYWP